MQITTYPKRGKNGKLYLLVPPNAEVEVLKHVECVEIGGEDTEIVEVTVGGFKTENQRRTFHTLINCLYLSGLTSYKSIEDLREYYILASGHIRKEIYFFIYEGKIHETDDLRVIPKEVGKYVKSIPASFSMISKDNATSVIGLIIADCETSDGKYNIASSAVYWKWKIIREGMDE